MKKVKKEEEKIQKGDEIKVVGGKYEGCYGWLNEAKGATEGSIHVLLADDAGGFVHKRLSRMNIRIKSHQAKPQNLIQVAMEQVPGLQKKMHGLILSIAKISQFHAHKEDVMAALQDHINIELSAAMDAQQKKSTGWILLSNFELVHKRKIEGNKSVQDNKSVRHKKGEQVEYVVH